MIAIRQLSTGRIHTLSLSISIMLGVALFLDIGNIDLQDITGVWLMSNRNVKVEVYKTGNLYSGKVIWMNEEANKKNFRVGDIIIEKLQYNSLNQIYEGGNFYGRGHRLNCEVKLVGPDLIKVRVSKGGLHQERFCKRVKITDN